MVWCGRGDSNPHALRRHPLKMVRLPVPPLPQEVKSKICVMRGQENCQILNRAAYFDGAGAAGAGITGAGAGAAGAEDAGADFGVFENCCSTELPTDATVEF
jgi:hypothetical protein